MATWYLNPFTGELERLGGGGGGAGGIEAVVTDSGTATPDGNNRITLSGSAGIDFSASGSTITAVIDLTELGTVATTYEGNSGSATPSANILQIKGDGTTASVSASGNTLTISSMSSSGLTFNTQSGSAASSGGAISIEGVAPLSTSAAGSTVSVLLATPLDVQYGGTGLASITDHGIMLGSGTSAVSVTSAPTDGQLLIGSTGADPSLDTLGEGEAINISNGPGTISIACELAESGVGSANRGVASFESSEFSVSSGHVSLSGNIASSFVTDSGTATPSGGAINIVGGTGASTVGSSDTVTINVSGGGFAWTDVTGTSQSIAVQNGYTANNASQIEFTLPATAAFGSMVWVVGKGAGGWKISEGHSSQTIVNGVLSTTGDGTGYIESTEATDRACLLCTTEDDVWSLIAGGGNITVV